MKSRILVLCYAAALGAQAKPPLRGQVVDEQGRPLANVAVCAIAEGLQWTTAELLQAPHVRTDVQGRFEIAGEPPARPPDWDSVLVVAPGRLSMLVARDDLDFGPIVLGPGAVLAGRVLDGKGAPIVGARVQARDYLREVIYVEMMQGGHRYDPMPVAAARTDARGAFVLTGACGSAAWLVADGEGLRPAGVGPVSALDPLSMVLEPAPMLRGRVVDPDHGDVGDLPLQMVGSVDGERMVRWAQTDRAGAFAFTWPGEPMRVWLSVKRGEQRLFASGDVEDPATEAVLTLRLLPPRPAARPSNSARSARKVQPEQIVFVRAVGPDDKPLAAFRASVHRITRMQTAYRTEAPQLGEFETAAASSVDGVAAAGVCDGDGEDGLLVLVQAPGMALACAQFDVGEKTLTVKLEPAGVIAGKVVDAASGKPLPGARVWSLARSDRFEHRPIESLAFFDAGPFAVTADADGAFRLEQVAGGNRHVFCRLPGHAEQPPTLVELPAGGERSDVRLELPPLSGVDGMLTGGLPPRTVGVRFKPHTPGSWSSNERSDYSSTFAVDAQGRFHATNMPPGTYEAQLVVMRPPRQGMPAKIPLGLVEIGFETKALELNGAAARPARVSGRVTGPVPATRLAVVSCAAPAGNTSWGFLCYEGAIAPLGPDGSFALEEPPGDRILVVVDLWTGAMLHREPVVQVAPGSERQVEAAVTAVPVQFRVTGADTGWHWLEIVPTPELWPAGVGQISKIHDRSYFLRMAARLEPGIAEGVLYLPAAPCTLRLRAAVSRARLPSGKDWLAQVELDPSQPKDRTVTIALTPK